MFLRFKIKARARNYNKFILFFPITICRFGMFTSITFNLYVSSRIYNRFLSSGVYIKLFISIDMTVWKIGNFYSVCETILLINIYLSNNNDLRKAPVNWKSQQKEKKNKNFLKEMEKHTLFFLLPLCQTIRSFNVV